MLLPQFTCELLPVCRRCHHSCHSRIACKQSTKLLSNRPAPRRDYFARQSISSPLHLLACQLAASRPANQPTDWPARRPVVAAARTLRILSKRNLRCCYTIAAYRTAAKIAKQSGGGGGDDEDDSTLTDSRPEVAISLAHSVWNSIADCRREELVAVVVLLCSFDLSKPIIITTSNARHSDCNLLSGSCIAK